ncbi:SDR family oxidoreductase [Mucilaginibacter sp. KACC 22063]|uniref:SDR family oxidoreductase n=1 Tax=Mucilaginibacter sp. KACC 22063 TaxID=3025666 RepID=UPI0023651795|nr:SDR family oxidoreductase [Mucilaginibacter sp. KACC 22063]WDF56615.1 SDR family oxidoreductase [Mucilaginibacter sp. KACC 22063]
MSLFRTPNCVKPPLNKQTIVITGASSGIGRATAIELARYGCKLVLAARNKEILDEVVEVCDRLGAKAIAVVTDVTDPQAVQNLAKDACIFGKCIDAWINIAGIGLLGDFSTIPVEAHKQVIETNLMGYLYGAYAAIPYFKKQGWGTIINMNSAGGYVAMPYSVAYTASKYGVRGYSEALRTELIDYHDIHVCDVYAGFVDTPGPAHAANYTGKKLKPIPPVIPTTKVASQIVELLQHPKDYVMVGSTAYMAKLGQIVSPKLTRWSLLRFMQLYFKNAEPEPVTNGTIFAPNNDSYKIAGGYTSKTVTPSRIKLGGIAAAAAAGAFFIVRKLL